MTIYYLPGSRVEKETEKAVLFSFYAHSPQRIARLIERSSKKVERIVELINEREEAWLPKSIILNQYGDFIQLRFLKRELKEYLVTVICEGAVDDLLGHEGEVKWQLALEHAVDIATAAEMTVNIPEREWRKVVSEARVMNLASKE